MTHRYDDDDKDNDEQVSPNLYAIPLSLSPLMSAHFRRIKRSFLACNVAMGEWLKERKGKKDMQSMRES